MATILHPWKILVAAMAGWITRQQDAVIDYLREENRVLKEQLGRKRLRLTDAQRRRLAVRGKAIGRRALTEVATLVILRVCAESPSSAIECAQQAGCCASTIAPLRRSIRASFVDSQCRSAE